MERSIFATSLCCIDGRIQIGIHDFLRQNYGVYYIDTITEPGVNKILAEMEDVYTINSLYQKVLASIEFHQSNLIAVVGHYDCAANPVSKELHIQQILKSIEFLKKLNLPGNPEIIGLWVNDNWEATLIANSFEGKKRKGLLSV